MEYIFNANFLKNKSNYLQFFTMNQASLVQKFHQSLEYYQPTQLVTMDKLATKHLIKQVYIKDESTRFNLNVFKGLGGTYCIARIIYDDLNLSGEFTYQEIMKYPYLSPLTFITATDGNHGRGIAYACKQFGHQAIIYMPKGSSLERLNAIKNYGA